MKVLLSLAALSALTAAAIAQDEPAKPALRGSAPAPAAPAAPAETVAPSTTEPSAMKLDAPASKSGEGIGLIPETLEPVPKPKGGREVTEPDSDQKIDKTTAAQDELKAKIDLREAKTKAERDPKVQEQWELSKTAKTPLQRREALTAYYKLLYGKAAKLAPSVAKQANTERDQLIRRMAQTRIAPTEPLPNE